LGILLIEMPFSIPPIFFAYGCCMADALVTLSSGKSQLEQNNLP